MNLLGTKFIGGILISIGLAGGFYGAILHLSGDPAGIGIGAIFVSTLCAIGAAMIYRSSDMPNLRSLWHGPGELDSNSRHDQGKSTQEEGDF